MHARATHLRVGVTEKSRSGFWSGSCCKTACSHHFVPSSFGPAAMVTPIACSLSGLCCLARRTQSASSVAQHACNRVLRLCARPSTSVWPYGNSRCMSSQAVEVQPHPHEETAKMVKGLSHPDPMISRYVHNCQGALCRPDIYRRATCDGKLKRVHHRSS